MDLVQMFAGLPFAWELNPQHSLAIMPVLAVQRLDVDGLEPFRPFSIHPEHVTNQGKDWSYGGGVRLGWLWQVNDQLDIGASYQTKLWMTEFDDYKGLLAEEGDFDIPPIIDLGFAYRFTPGWILVFHYQRIQFEEVASVSNAADLVFSPGTTPLGTSNGLGFGWEDVDVYKIGLQWEYRSDLSFRAGFGYASETFEGDQALFNVLAPAVIRKHFTFGIGKTLASGNEVNLAIMYAPEEKVHGTNPNTGPQTGYVEMSQWDLELGWTFRF
jgi:long-chain fatty acid transport protein